MSLWSALSAFRESNPSIDIKQTSVLYSLAVNYTNVYANATNGSIDVSLHNEISEHSVTDHLDIGVDHPSQANRETDAIVQNLEIPDGPRVIIVCPLGLPGAGKTTLLESVMSTLYHDKDWCTYQHETDEGYDVVGPDGASLQDLKSNKENNSSVKNFCSIVSSDRIAKFVREREEKNSGKKKSGKKIKKKQTPSPAAQAKAAREAFTKTVKGLVADAKKHGNNGDTFLFLMDKNFFQNEWARLCDDTFGKMLVESGLKGQVVPLMLLPNDGKINVPVIHELLCRMNTRPEHQTIKQLSNKDDTTDCHPKAIDENFKPILVLLSMALQQAPGSVPIVFPKSVVCPTNGTNDELTQCPVDAYSTALNVLRQDLYFDLGKKLDEAPAGFYAALETIKAEVTKFNAEKQSNDIVTKTSSELVDQLKHMASDETITTYTLPEPVITPQVQYQACRPHDRTIIKIDEEQSIEIGPEHHITCRYFGPKMAIAQKNLFLEDWNTFKEAHATVTFVPSLLVVHDGGLTSLKLELATPWSLSPCDANYIPHSGCPFIPHITIQSDGDRGLPPKLSTQLLAEAMEHDTGLEGGKEWDSEISHTKGKARSYKVSEHTEIIFEPTCYNVSGEPMA